MAGCSSLFLAIVALTAPPKFYLETTPTRKVECVARGQVVYSRGLTDVYLVSPQKRRDQQGAECSFAKKSDLFVEESGLGRQLLIQRHKLDKRKAGKIEFEVNYSAQLFSRRLRPLASSEKPPEVAKLTRDEVLLCIEAADDYNFDDPAFEAWLDERKLRRRLEETDLQYARRVYDTIRAGFRYHYQPEMDRHATAVIKSGRSDCGGLSYLFIATLRSQLIPARAVFGRWAKSGTPETKNAFAYGQQHVKSEFYITGLGWVPVDVSAGVENWETRPELDWFGYDGGDFVTIGIDPPIPVTLEGIGKIRMTCMQGPVHWYRTAIDDVSVKYSDTWEVRTVE